MLYQVAQKLNLFNSKSFTASRGFMLAAVAGLALAPLGAVASTGFGSNGTGYQITTEAGNTFGGAIEFTTSQSMTLNSVALAVSGYTGANHSTLSLSLLQNNDYIPGINAPNGISIAQAFAAPNNSSSVNFNLGAQLQANTSYWLFVDLSVPNGGGSGVSCQWDGITLPSGLNITGSESYADGFQSSTFQSLASSTGSALTVEAVPEPSVTSLAASVVLLRTGWVYFRKQRNKKA